MSSRLTGISVLVADDDMDSREFLETALQLAGAEVRAAIDGSSALELLAVWRPDVLLLDLSMPGMDGTELLPLVRDRADLRSIPAIAVTASVFPRHRAKSRAAGFDWFLGKPVDLDELIEMIVRLTGRVG